MNTLEILKQAIKTRKPISFEYNKQGKIHGKRIGNPHAIFIVTTIYGAQSTKVHIVQTEGVSDTSPSNFPDFRLFDIEELSHLKILEDQHIFTPHEKYNPEWDGYKNVIAKI